MLTLISGICSLRFKISVDVKPGAINASSLKLLLLSGMSDDRPCGAFPSISDPVAMPWLWVIVIGAAWIMVLESAIIATRKKNVLPILSVLMLKVLKVLDEVFGFGEYKLDFGRKRICTFCRKRVFEVLEARNVEI